MCFKDNVFLGLFGNVFEISEIFFSARKHLETYISFKHDSPSFNLPIIPSKHLPHLLPFIAPSRHTISIKQSWIIQIQRAQDFVPFLIWHSITLVLLIPPRDFDGFTITIHRRGIFGITA